ncbi:MAG: DUF4238 domain-containing protein [Methylococcaceae bacterium]
MKPKKQHYVPQFILRNFACGKSKKIWVFDKRNGKSFCSSVKNSACENYFYETSEDFASIGMEETLSKIEGFSSAIFQKITSEESLENLLSLEHKFLCLFTTIQLIRTKTAREQIKTMNDLLVSWVENSGFSIDDVENLEKMTEEDVSNAHILDLKNLVSSLVPHVLDKSLSLVKAPKGSVFFISDNPITLHNHFPREGRGNKGLNLKGIEIHFPISFKLCLVFLCSETTEMIKNKVDAELQRRRVGMGFPVDISEPLKFVDGLNDPKSKSIKSENVLFHNSLQVIQSSRFIYSNKNIFELVEDMLKTNPEVKFSPEIISNFGSL